MSNSLSRIGEGNGNPLQRSCLENPRDRGAWWAAVYGVTQSQTRLKGLSSSSRLVIAFLARSKRLLISWLQSPSAVILEPRFACSFFAIYTIILLLNWYCFWSYQPGTCLCSLDQTQLILIFLRSAGSHRTQTGAIRALPPFTLSGKRLQGPSGWALRQPVGHGGTAGAAPLQLAHHRGSAKTVGRATSPWCPLVSAVDPRAHAGLALTLSGKLRAACVPCSFTGT